MRIVIADGEADLRSWRPGCIDTSQAKASSSNLDVDLWREPLEIFSIVKVKARILQALA